MATHFDVVIVGAGLSGIGAAHRLQTHCPGKSYAILEARDAIGGTWDLFRYPGIRSDSDMFTLGYPFKPWRDPRSIAPGASILSYVRETAAELGIDRHVRFDTRVVGADWSSADAVWTLEVEEGAPDGGVVRRTLTCGFLHSCAGYYDYEQPHVPAFAGAEDFTGELVVPQFWPEDLDYSGRRVVVIGSGATAVTLVPAMATGPDAAAHVTMLQRSPTWIAAVPGRDRFADGLRERLPPRLAHRLVRGKNVLWNLGFYQFCQRRPELAKRLLLGLTAKAVGPELAAEHFTPSYRPWDQRFCATPDADLFEVIRDGRAEVVTDHVDRFVPEGIRLRSGRVLEADVVVSATGLTLLAFGGIAPSVDGRRVELSEQFVWRGAMVTGLPNFAVCMGYTNASWTLRADLSNRLVCKVLNHMDAHDYASVVPRPDRRLEELPLLDLKSGYVQRSIADFPRQGHVGPWKVRQNYLLDSATTLRGNLSRTLEGTPRRPCAGEHSSSASEPEEGRRWTSFSGSSPWSWR